jgi:manganese/zinc/iron transport system substrate-binding protein
MDCSDSSVPTRSTALPRLPLFTWGLGGLLLLPALLLGCADADTPPPVGARPQVVATTGMIADVAAQLGGEGIRVVGLMGPGVDPHLFKASAGDLRTLSQADLILYNGLHLEAALANVLEGMQGRIRTRAVTSGIPEALLLPSETFQGAWDPHVWMDVPLWMEATRIIAEELLALNPSDAEGIRARADALFEEMQALDVWVRLELEKVPPSRRVLITAHDAFHYFGRAYGFEVRGLQGISTVAEAGTRDVQELSRFILEREVPALFVESSISPRTVEAVRAAVAAQGGVVALGGTLFSDALGSAGTPEGTYLGMIRHNVRTLAEALSGSLAGSPGAPATGEGR